VLKPGGEFIIGQLRDSNGNFNQSTSFGGKLTQLNVWNEILTADEIESISKSCYNNVGTILDWSKVINHEAHGAVYNESSNSCKALRQSMYYRV
jgi:hypothetical protein